MSIAVWVPDASRGDAHRKIQFSRLPKCLIASLKASRAKALSLDGRPW